jgi:NAD-dependent dihydropyrimidine dehydrogenase PreA subunit
MKRNVITIDRDKCNGCGLCIPNCHEGALQLIDGKATLVSELMCDGLGACLGHCPIDALKIESHEAEPYDERKVMEHITSLGENVVIAHLQHLKEHNEMGYLKEAISSLQKNKENLSFSIDRVMQKAHNVAIRNNPSSFTPEVKEHSESGCPGSRAMSFASKEQYYAEDHMAPSQLTHWPIQLHLINPLSNHFKESDLLLAADCTAFSLGSFHAKYLKGKKLIIACPKLDSNKEVYVNKLVQLIDQSLINTLHIIHMEVPCCGGLVQLAQISMNQAKRKIPLKETILSIDGSIKSEHWL